MTVLTGEHFIKIIDEIFAYSSHYAGFAIKPNGGTVKFLAYQFNLSPADIVIILNQMVADEQLRKTGYFYPDTTYGPNKEKV